MLATIRDDTWNVLNMQHIIPNSKIWDYSDKVVVINRLKDPPTWLNEATTLEMPPIPTHLHLFVIANEKDKHFCYAITYEKFQYKCFLCVLNCFILHTIPCITKW